MHVQLVARQPSTHHLFRFKPEAPPNRVQSRTKSHFDRHIDRSVPAQLAYQTYGRVGMLIGILESLNDMPIDGNVTV
ncbi:MAG: hypothetical protein HY975_03215, partial [Candidatus Kerfeldbacteria bacterium]|nr:hypothetical protein [Candidatus Kerfeldbacteria bacterium]